MLYNKSVSTPSLKINSSVYLATYLFAVHGITFLVLVISLDSYSLLHIIILILFFLGFVYSWVNKEPVTALYAPVGDSYWRLQIEDRIEKVILGEKYYITNWLLILPFKDDNNKIYRVLVLPDSGKKDEIRRLRTFLRQCKNTE